MRPGFADLQIGWNTLDVDGWSAGEVIVQEECLTGHVVTARPVTVVLAYHSFWVLAARLGTLRLVRQPPDAVSANGRCVSSRLR